MKVLSLTTTLMAALALTAFGQGDSTLRSQISLKEKQLAEIQKELSDLRSQLTKPTTGTYTVQTGDTLHSIARRYKVSTSDLMKWNKINDPTKLGIGDQLVVSGSVSPPRITSTTSAPKAKGYVVSQGDTFYSIARRHKMSLTQLRSLNPDVSSQLIAPGQTLQVTGTATPKTQVAQVAAAKPVVIKETKKPVTENIVKISTKKEEPTAVTSKKTAPAKPAPALAAKVSEKPISTPPAPPVVEDPKPASSAAAVILTDEITFADFATKHGTSTDQLNALNGWSLPKSTVLARGSEIFVPN